MMLIGYANYILLGMLVYVCPILIVLSVHTTRTIKGETGKIATSGHNSSLRE